MKETQQIRVVKAMRSNVVMILNSMIILPTEVERDNKTYVITYLRIRCRLYSSNTF